MAIDLGACIGCNVCTIACQAENNIPVVGKEEVARGREMHWIRVDNYFEGAPEDPRLHFQPVPCMHCENAPCELVCPVAATVHSSEGLNQMVYNRCIGTRYCSNNCPYKVRRFNFLEYDRNRFESAPVLKLLAQSRCDRAHARRHGKMHVLRSAHPARADRVRESRIGRSATARSCPPARRLVPRKRSSSATSTIRKAASRSCKASPLNYGLLAELNTRPRTTYLAKLRNPNPEV